MSNEAHMYIFILNFNYETSNFDVNRKYDNLQCPNVNLGCHKGWFLKNALPKIYGWHWNTSPADGCLVVLPKATKALKYSLNHHTARFRVRM